MIESESSDGMVSVRYWAVMASMLAFAVTASANSQSIMPTSDATIGDANLVIFRVHAEPTVWSSAVKIDGKKMISIGQKKYTAIHLDPGQHHVTLSWPLLAAQRSAAIDLDLSDGNVHYLEITGIIRLLGAGPGPYLRWQEGSSIQEIEPGAGSKAVTECCTFKAAK